MNFAVSMIDLVKNLKENRKSIISNQIGKNGTSVGANMYINGFTAQSDTEDLSDLRYVAALRRGL